MRPRRLSTRCPLAYPGRELAHLFVATLVGAQLLTHLIGRVEDGGVIPATEPFTYVRER